LEFLNKMVEIAVNYRGYFLQGIGYTMLIALTGTIFGLGIGLLAGVIRTIPPRKSTVGRIVMKIINFIITAYVEIFRGTPMMVQAMVIYWGYAFMNNGATLPLIPAGIFIVSINTGAYMTEIVRGGIISIDRGQTEAAYSIGMTHLQTMLHVVLPQTMRNILPAISNEFVINIKDTSVLNVIGVTELYFFTAKVNKMTWAIFQTFMVACIIYFILTFSVTRLLRFIERKLEGPNSYILHQSSTMPNTVYLEKEEGEQDADS